MRVRGLRTLSLLALALVAACFAPGVASAGIRTATITDPQDAPAAPAGAAKNPDLRSVDIQYNDQAGTITAVARFYESVAARSAETNITFDLGASPVAKGYSCEPGPKASAVQGLLFVKQSIGLLTLDGYGPLILSTSAVLSADGLTFTVRFVRAQLVGFDYRCADVTSVWMSSYTNPNCNYFDCPTTATDLDPVYKNAWFDGFAPTPAAPTNVTVTTTTGSSVAVEWKDDDTSVTGYEVLRDGQVVGTTSSTSFTVPGLACGKSYTLSIRADTPYTHSADTTVSASTAVCAPKSPAHVKVVGATTTSLTVAWGAPANATDYVVLVSSHSGRTKATQLTVGGLHCGTRYKVDVRAVGPGGKSASVTAVGRTRHC